MLLQKSCTAEIFTVIYLSTKAENFCGRKKERVVSIQLVISGKILLLKAESKKKKKIEEAGKI